MTRTLGWIGVEWEIGADLGLVEEGAVVGEHSLALLEGRRCLVVLVLATAAAVVGVGVGAPHMPNHPIFFLVAGGSGQWTAAGGGQRGVLMAARRGGERDYAGAVLNVGSQAVGALCGSELPISALLKRKSQREEKIFTSKYLDMVGFNL